VLDGYRATIHWENIAGLRQEFPRILSTDDLFVIDRDRYTCSGGIAPLDMTLTLISQQYGIELAADISEEFIHDRIRTTNDQQRDPLKLRIGLGHTKLVEAVRLMEANIEEPIPLDDLSRYAGVSRRQLERLFRKYLNYAPTRYYLKLRLIRARQLLLQTDMSVTAVALSCGFTSTPHFSKCYRELYGWSPSRERRMATDWEDRSSGANQTVAG
jgi:transcriptional regulator GlxA family with amidase domain